MDFQKTFPNLFQFFNGYFADAAWDDTSDAEITAKYIDDCSESELSKSKNELENLLLNVDKYWKEVSSESNRHFNNVEASIAWLNEIKNNFR